MAKSFNAEEIAELLQNPHVINICGNRIKFSVEFKQMAYQQMLSGKTMRTIFAENGIDPDILGDSRIWGFANKLRECAGREEGFNDLREHNERKPANDTKERTLATRVEDLEHELAYTKQEVEFLKKIHLADLEARKQWESKHHQQ